MIRGARPIPGGSRSGARVGWVATCLGVVLWVGGGLAGTARAQPSDGPGGLQIGMRPLEPEQQGPVPQTPYTYVWELSADAPMNAIADRRLLHFEIDSPGVRRKVRCRHPARPRRADYARLRDVGPGQRWQEWIDLRVYCWGRGEFEALEAGGRVTVYYGFPRSGRGRFLTMGSRDATPQVRWVTGASFELPAQSEGDSSALSPAKAMEVQMRPHDTASPRGLLLRLRAKPRGRARRVYLRTDLWSFEVDGPTGKRTCGLQTLEVSPIRDFFRRLGRRGARVTLLASTVCPGVFTEPGVYEVVPILSLPYGGERHGLNATTGKFEGEATPVRLRQGPYREHLLTDPGQGDREGDAGETGDAAAPRSRGRG